MRSAVLCFLLPAALVAGAAWGASPYKEVIGLSTNWDVGFGNSVFLVGSHEDVGSWRPTNGIKFRFTSGNVWTGQVAVQAGTPLEYKFISRSTVASNWCDPANVVWAPGTNRFAQLPAQPPAPFAGKTIYYHSGWTSVFITVVKGTNATDYPLTMISTGRTAAEFLYRVTGIGEAGEPIEFVMHDDQGHYDNAPYTGYGSPGAPNYYTSLDAFFLQGGHIFNYRPPAAPSSPSIVTTVVPSTVGSIPSHTVRVYLARGYTNNLWKKYPVLYMHDGQNIFSTGGNAFDQWDVDVTANREISQGRVRECIIVGVANNSQRSAEYMPPGDVYLPDPLPAIGNLYMKYMAQDVRSYIDQTYRTLPEPRNTLIAGSSLGGIISVYFGYETNVYGSIGAFSPGFARATNYATYLAGVPRKDVKIFIDNGTLEEDVNGANYWLYPRIAYDNFMAQGYVVGQDLLLRVGCDRGHVNRLWGEHFTDFARFTLNVLDEPNLLIYGAYPQALQAAKRQDGTVSVTVTAMRSYSHTLEWSGTSVTGPWVSVTSSPRAVLPWSNIGLVDTNAGSQGGYYRAASLPVP